MQWLRVSVDCASTLLVLHASCTSLFGLLKQFNRVGNSSVLYLNNKNVQYFFSPKMSYHMLKCDLAGIPVQVLCFSRSESPVCWKRSTGLWVYVDLSLWILCGCVCVCVNVFLFTLGFFLWSCCHCCMKNVCETTDTIFINDVQERILFARKCSTTLSDIKTNIEVLSKSKLPFLRLTNSQWMEWVLFSYRYDQFLGCTD